MEIRSQYPDRNSPCYCGSGKKYKKCHMGVDQTGAVKKILESKMNHEFRSSNYVVEDFRNGGLIYFAFTVVTESPDQLVEITQSVPAQVVFADKRLISAVSAQNPVRILKSIDVQTKKVLNHVRIPYKQI